MPSFFRLVRIAMTVGVFLPAAVAAASIITNGPNEEFRPFLKDSSIWAAVMLGIGAVLYAAFGKLFEKCGAWFEEESGKQADLLDAIPLSNLNKAIFFSAAASLILELSLIRWQSSVFEFFAFYKNFSLVACFAGLGTGYAISRHKQIPLFAVAPLVAFQFILLICLRHIPDHLISSILFIPVAEQTYMGNMIDGGAAYYAAVYLFLATAFVISALCCVPVGQLCGRLMDRADNLKAYGMNLLGSLAGIAITVLLSFFWTPPLIWFAAVFLLIVPFICFNKRSVILTSTSLLLMLSALAWPVNFPFMQIYSPYQLLEVGPGAGGLLMLKAAGNYYQRVHNLSKEIVAANVHNKTIAEYYNLPYLVHPNPESVAIVGSGTGNDVASALRAGAKSVDAIEIDPVIARLGWLYHPEKPYRDPRVHLKVNDARAFLRTNTDTKYDVIVFGLLDSHTLGSHTSNLRLDSYVYTLEAIKEARSHLKPNGIICLSFCILSQDMVKKVYRMVSDAFDGKPPVLINSHYDNAFSYINSPDPSWSLPKDLFEGTKLVVCDARELGTDFPEISTDDWPFFYMDRRVFPLSYLGMAVLVAGLSYMLIRSLSAGKPSFEKPQFALLGAGFMLIETKAITELGLHFGNTWIVTSIVITAILLMAFLANFLVSKTNVRSVVLAHVMVLVSIGVGLAVAMNGGLPSTLAGKIGTVAILTSPVFFSGIAFSGLIKQTNNIAGAMSMNILGAIAGALLEYLAMYTGYRALYVVAAVLYFASLIITLVQGAKKQNGAGTSANAGTQDGSTGGTPGGSTGGTTERSQGSTQDGSQGGTTDG